MRLIKGGENEFREKMVIKRKKIKKENENL